MSLGVGTLVVSVSGRDEGRVLAVVGSNETHLFLADGRKRRIEKPKQKKIKHVRVLGLRLTQGECEKLEKNELTNKMLYNGIRQSIEKQTV